jgi:2-dehydropantoate 2-reductase
MRFVVFGAGAVGGVVGARLHQAGHSVALIARGAHYQAIRARGLTLEEPDRRTVLEIEVSNSPANLRWGRADVVLLAVKSQDTAGAIQDLREAAPRSTAVVCLQNGVENERVALRLFENVYGAVVMLPAAHIEAGVVQSHATKLTGILDLGRYPSGADDLVAEVAAALSCSRFSSRVSQDVMRLKHAKLILNLANAASAIFKPGPETDRLTAAARDEGRAVLRAAGIEFDAAEVSDVAGRWERMGVRRDHRPGSSTWQSLQRDTGTVETDYLNGEIVLLGRVHGVDTPVNEALCRWAARVAGEFLGPQALDAHEILSNVGAGEAAWTR